MTTTDSHHSLGSQGKHQMHRWPEALGKHMVKAPEDADLGTERMGCRLFVKLPPSTMSV